MVSVFDYVIGTTSIMLLLLLSYWFFWVFYFLRDPQRKIPPGKNLISPADGKVILVKTYDFRKGKKVLKIRKGRGKIESLASDVSKKVIVVSIFMSPLDVHVNRAPCDGTVLSSKHTKGRFYNAGNLEKSLYNEKNEILINAAFGKVKVIQIAGYLARRIESFVNPGQIVTKGQRIGLINLGSQVTVIMPAEKMDIAVKVGRRVKAGSSIIARLKR